MELIVNSKEFNYFEKNECELIIGYNFYDVSGRFLGFHEKNMEYYPRANFRVVLEIRGKKIELGKDDCLYRTEENEYFLGQKI